MKRVKTLKKEIDKITTIDTVLFPKTVQTITVLDKNKKPIISYMGQKIEH